MPRLLLFGLVACGAPAFVPVTVETTDAFDDPTMRYLLFVRAAHKLNSTCTSNCEMGSTYEDGGCSNLTVDLRNGAVSCTPSGGDFWWPPEGGALPADGGVAKSAPRMIAPGSELTVFFFPEDPACLKKIAVPPGPLTVLAQRSQAIDACAFSTK
jgi:hypothetical protein